MGEGKTITPFIDAETKLEVKGGVLDDTFILQINAGKDSATLMVALNLMSPERALEILGDLSSAVGVFRRQIENHYNKGVT